MILCELMVLAVPLLLASDPRNWEQRKFIREDATTEKRLTMDLSFLDF